MAGIPIAGGANVSGLQEMAKQLAKEQLKPEGQSKFQGMINQVNQPQNTQATNQVKGINDAQRVAGPRKIDDVKNVGQINATKKSSGVEGIFRQFVNRINTDTNGLNDIMKQALSGKDLSHQQLFAIQITAQQYTMQIETGAKLVEKGADALKQTLQTQV